MNSKRLLAIANEVLKEDIVLDVGCDHGLLSVYLKQNNLCKEVYASDVSENALNSAKNNFKKNNLDIKTFVSDGFQNINVPFNTAVIAGMGTSTILKIISGREDVKKLILASNNDYYKLRKELNKSNYKIVKEKVIYEKKHYYIIMVCIKGKQRLNKKELMFGISKDSKYMGYLLNKNKELIKLVPLKKKIKLYYECLLLKGLIEKK